jgi:general secretion pathway protein M
MIANRVAPGGVTSVAILVFVICLLVLLAAAPFMRLSTAQEQLGESQEELVKLTKQIERQAELRKKIAGANANSHDTTLLLEGETTGIAGANLQKIVSGLILEYGGTASSFQVLPSEADGNLTRIPMSVSISVSVDALRDLLYRLETGTPLIFVDGITVHPDTESARNNLAYFLGPLDVSLRISGFLKKEAL